MAKRIGSGVKYEWKQFDVMSVAKIQAVIMAIFGFIIGLFIAGISMLGGAASSFTGSLPGATGVVGIGAVIIFPIMYGIGGFISGAIGAIIYNFVAVKIGGIIVYH